MRIAVVTKIFPSSLEPLSAPFNRQQLTELARQCDLEVLEAIPYVPFARMTSTPARAARLTALPAGERIHGVDVTYVRQLYIPRVGLPVAVPLYLVSLLPHRERLRAADVVLATWAYPDGCATALAARALAKPCVVKVHGSDVNVVLRRPAARAIAARILPVADAVVAVSHPLADELVRLGVPRERVHVVANGVDASLFFPRERSSSKKALGVADDARVLLFVGRLEPEKGLLDLLDAFDAVLAKVPDVQLVLVGDGVSIGHARARASRCKPGALRVMGALPHGEVAAWIGACDALTLPSWAEGTPNVVLEALASGRPVVATTVGGIPDLIADERCGLLVPPRDPHALADAITRALARRWDADVIRTFGPASWHQSASALRNVLELAAARARSSRSWRARSDEVSSQSV
jgi:teichuronic acid biosynthesis glycosyltransferase TuaC